MLTGTFRRHGGVMRPLVGIGIVVSAVFVPMAFFGGSTGEMYKQFAVTIVSAMMLSVFIALTFTPALCATILKPHNGTAQGRRQSMLGWLGTSFGGFFERNFGHVTNGYGGIVRFATGRPLMMMLVYGLLVGGMVLMFQRTPTAFLPEEDQGALLTIVQAPTGTTAEATEAILSRVSEYYTTAEAENVESVFSVRGFSFAGQGQNMGMMFVRLKEWDTRTSPEASAEAIGGRAFGPLMGGIREAMVIPIVPPAVLELGNSDGFSGILTAAAGQSLGQLLAAL